MNIGFIGLGNMGSGMATNIAQHCYQDGHQLTVYDIDAQRVDAVVNAGATAADTIDALSAWADVVFTSLPSAREVALVAPQLLENLRPGGTWFETSTNDLSEWQAITQQAPSTVTLIDAPVTGGAEGARAGTLTMLIGGQQTDVDQHTEILDYFTNNAVLMGPAGAGYTTKLIQLHLNYLVAQGIGETLALGTKANLDLSVLYGVLQNSCAQSYVVDSYIPKVLDNSYDPSFALGLARKDMRLISSLGNHLGLSMPLAELVSLHYEQATEKYGFDAPHLSIVKPMQEQ